MTDLLFKETNDWSFVIKAHALLESIVCQLLAAHLEAPALEYVLAERVQMEDRIEMLKALNIADAKDRQMMRLLGRLRNHLVHNALQTDFKFSEYFTNKQNRNNFVDTFATTWPDPIAGTEPPVSRPDYIKANPRYAIWASIISIVNRTVDAKSRSGSTSKKEEVLEGLRQADPDSK